MPRPHALIPTGTKVGKLTVIRLLEYEPGSRIFYECKCECGSTTKKCASRLRKGAVKSCGCEKGHNYSEYINKTKVCTKCGENKSLDRFQLRSDTKKRRNICRMCAGKKYEETKQKKRNDAIAMATPLWSSRVEIKNIYSNARKLRNHGESVEVDHIIPLQHKKICGLHVPWNLSIVTAKKNSKKGNRVSDAQLTRTICADISDINYPNEQDLLSSREDLCAIFDNKKNGKLVPAIIHLSVPISLNWKCQNGHTFTKSLRHMLKNSECPICKNPDYSESYADKSLPPNLVAEFDFEKNTEGPDAYTTGSNEKIFWLCPEHNHSYRRSPYERSAGCGCTECKKLFGIPYKSTLRQSNEIVSLEHNDGTSFIGTRREFEKLYAIKPSEINRVVQGKSASLKGWFAPGQNPKDRIKKYTWVHPNLGTFTGTLPEFQKKYNLNKSSVHNVVNPHSKSRSVYGWMLEGTIIPETEKITLEHPEHGIVTATRQEFMKTYSLNPSGITQVLNGMYKTTKGWRLPKRPK